jgi:GNAT superfamily N-acetyltransferase
MAIQLVPAEPAHFEDLARICHLAFDSLHERHRVHRDVPSEEVGRLMIGGVLFRPDYVGVTAIEDNRIVGSNFLLLADEVCGVGPITVDPSVQSRGIGKMLMQWVIDEARRRRGPRPHVRLYQEALNTTSLSLYTNLGFHWRDAAALMLPRPASADDATIRPITADHRVDVDRLSTRHYGFSRANDFSRLLAMQIPGFIRERDGRVVGYQLSTLFGHAAAETNDDLLALASHTARHVPPPAAVVIVPMHQAALFRAALDAGFTVAKLLNYMSLESFAMPAGPSLPSIQC